MQWCPLARVVLCLGWLCSLMAVREACLPACWRQVTAQPASLAAAVLRASLESLASARSIGYSKVLIFVLHWGCWWDCVDTFVELTGLRGQCVPG